MGNRIIGITCGTSFSEESGPRQALNRTYVWAIEQAGGVPVILPVTREENVIRRYLGVLDGLMLTGGVDIAPEHYRQPPHPKLGTVDADRDATELPLLRDALAQDMPIFAICRGIQVLNVVTGGILWQDIPSECPSDIHHSQTQHGIPRDEPTHDIAIEPESRLRQIVGASEMRTNSLHHQALKDIGTNLVVTARTEDGIVEAVESTAHRWVVGVQFHPEETTSRDEKSRRLFAAFLEEVNRR